MNVSSGTVTAIIVDTVITRQFITASTVIAIVAYKLTTADRLTAVDIIIK